MSLHDFLSPVPMVEITGDETFRPGQLGATIDIYTDTFPDIDQADIIFVGCGEQRGRGYLGKTSDAPDLIRKHFFSLFYWHEKIKMADIGNVTPGATYNDTIAALQTVISELTELGKTVVVLGGSHDLTLSQYYASKKAEQLVEITAVDAIVDLDMESPFRSDNFLMELFTSEPNYVKHYNHIGFQSYLLHPGMLQTLDKLKFDFFRVGHVKEAIKEMEPAIRSSHIFSFDINAIANAYAPANQLTPNGFNGEEACVLMQYAGMSSAVQTIGIYGYDPQQDKEELTAKQIAHMLWYMIDGKHRRYNEASLEDLHQFNEYQIAFAEIESTFLQSKKTSRWWMQLPDKTFIPCSYKDYQSASNNEIPERWFRAQQR
ncbi:formimidoylglutamase [Niabella insulamsoli]|uniref:formimidoylglutamase n=1 Tax=Niabella insulamsoli TaxID=3144874 RepID=UPI0031FCFA66